MIKQVIGGLDEKDFPSPATHNHAVHTCALEGASPVLLKEKEGSVTRQELEKLMGLWGGVEWGQGWRGTKTFKRRKPGETCLGVRPSQSLATQRLTASPHPPAPREAMRLGTYCLSHIISLYPHPSRQWGWSTEAQGGGLTRS